ncbi:hypothetical protein [Cupriavidus sp. YAF13]|uniref:hypothetical protein n=1 Tax=Cupriavidus sp. YAF13 TaxID=3233075 RepID=UPI003F92EEF4
MALNIYIDISSLACPMAILEGTEKSEELEGYIHDLIFVKDNLNSSLVQFWGDVNLPDLLVESGLYPLFSDIKYLLIETGLDSVYHPRDVNRVFELLVKKMPFSQPLINSDVTFENISMAPRMGISFDDDVKDAQDRAVGSLAFAHSIGEVTAGKTILFADIAEQGSNSAKVEGSVSTATWHRRHNGPDVEYPFDLESEFPYVRRISKWHESLDCCNEVEHCYNSGALAELLSIGVAQRCAQGAKGRSWRLGGELYNNFNALFLRNDRTASKAFFESCLDTIAMANLPQTHQLRKGMGGNSGARTQGNAVAWRRDIGHDYHLHYWEIDGLCEISNIVMHNDFSISRCSVE